MAALPKIVFVINKAEIGGAEIHTQLLAEGLRARHFEAIVFAIKPGGAAAPNVLTPQGPFSLSRRVGDLRALTAKNGIDILVGINLRPMAVIAAARWGLGRRPRTAGIFHSTKLPSLKQHLIQFAHLPICLSLDRFVFISQNQRRYWAGRGLRPARALTILNGIDLQRYAPAVRQERRDALRAELGFAPGDVVAAMSAVFRPEKNHLQFLEALARLRAQGAPLKGLLIGDGPRRPEIEARAQALGLSDALVITGFQTDVRPFVAAADLGFNCSTSIETLSLSALEILAMGVPMLMSDTGGASEIIDESCGALFRVGDLAAMDAALLRFLDPHTRARAGEAGRARVEAAFSQSAMCNRYAEAFTALAQ